MIRYATIFLLTLTSCKSSQLQSQELSDGSQKPINHQPEWVLQKPNSSAYYVGVGNASLYDPDHQATAKLEALDDLASEISVTIASTSLLNQVENNAGFRENFRSSIQSSTRQEIESYELVDSWRDDRYLWVYYRLNKSTFEKIRTEKKEAAHQKAKNSFVNAKAFESKDCVQAIRFYAQTIETLKNYLNEKNEIIIEDKGVLLANESYIRIQKILSGISLTALNHSTTFTSLEKEKEVRIKAQSNIGNPPVKRLPVFLYIGGKKEEKSTNSEGIVSTVIHRNEAFQGPLTIKTNLDFLLDYPITHALLKKFPPAEIEVNFSVTPPSFVIKSNEENLNVRVADKLLAPLMAKILTEKGALVTEGETDEYTLLINAETRKGIETSGLFSAYLDFTITIKDSQKKALFSYSFYDVKGLHTSYEKAGLKAYQKVESELAQQIKLSLDEHFFNKD